MHTTRRQGVDVDVARAAAGICGMADFVVRVQPARNPEKPELDHQYTQALGHLGYADLVSQDTGERTQADSRIGLALLEETADAGYAPAQFMLAQLMDGRRRDVSRNDELMFRWTEACAAQGLPEGQLLLSTLYVRGRGCSPNRIRSVQWLRTASEQQYLPALVRLGLYYLEDGAVAEALGWFRQALELRDGEGRRDADALYFMGNMYCEGLGGAPRNTAEGRMLLREAAEMGHHEAAADLVDTARGSSSGFCCSPKRPKGPEWIRPTLTMTQKEKVIVIRADLNPVTVMPFEAASTPVATAVVAEVAAAAENSAAAQRRASSLTGKGGINVDHSSMAAPPAVPEDDLGDWVTRFNSEGSSTTSMAMRLPDPPEPPAPPRHEDQGLFDQASCFVRRARVLVFFLFRFGHAPLRRSTSPSPFAGGEPRTSSPRPGPGGRTRRSSGTRATTTRRRTTSSTTRSPCPTSARRTANLRRGVF